MFTARKKTIFLLLAVIFVLNCKTISRLTAKSGSEFVVQVETDEPNKDEIFQQAINKLEHEINAFGIIGEVGEIPGKPYQLNVKIYEPEDIERIKKLLFTNYKLELKKVISPPSPSPLKQYPTEEAAKQQAAENQEILPYTDRSSGVKSFVVVEKEPIVTGKDVRMASAIQGLSGTNNSTINFELKKEGAEKLGDWTGKNINDYIAIVLNKQAVSVAYIKSAIYDNGQIDGRFTKDEAEDIAFSLNSGHLPANFNVLSEKVFGK